MRDRRFTIGPPTAQRLARGRPYTAGADRPASDKRLHWAQLWRIFPEIALLHLARNEHRRHDNDQADRVGVHGIRAEDDRRGSRAIATRTRDDDRQQAR
jgi:hypothetical protein